MEATTILSLEERVECLLKDSIESFSVKQLLRGLNINDGYEQATQKEVLKIVQVLLAKRKVIHHKNNNQYHWRFGQA